MMRRLDRLVASLAIAVVPLLAGCVSTEEVGGSDEPTPTTAPPPLEIGTLDTDVSFGGVTVRVYRITSFAQSPLGVPRVEATLRSENLSGNVQRTPDVWLTCDESANTGDWYQGSTWEPNSPLPVNAVTEGTVVVGFPLKGENPEYPVVRCTTPRLVVTITGTRETATRVVAYPIDAAVIDASIRAPKGPNLPLPQTSS